MENNKYLSTINHITYGRGYTYSLQYHIVWVTKHKEDIFLDNVKHAAEDYLSYTLKTLDVNPISINVRPNYIHLMIDCKPQLKLSDAIKILKGNTARWLFLQFPELKEQVCDGHLWNPSYFVSTINEQSLEQISDYINHQRSK